jgi:hypothetical protein
MENLIAVLKQRDDEVRRVNALSILLSNSQNKKDRMEKPDDFEQVHHRKIEEVKNVTLRIARTSSNTRSSNRSKARKTEKVEKYISPFVKQALETASRRIQQSSYKNKNVRDDRVRSITASGGVWDSDTRTNPLFDPNIRKTEIFRLSPRKYNRSDKNVNHNLKNAGLMSSPDSVTHTSLGLTSPKNNSASKQITRKFIGSEFPSRNASGFFSSNPKRYQDQEVSANEKEVMP